jgi:hypothetical protein
LVNRQMRTEFARQLIHIDAMMVQRPRTAAVLRYARLPTTTTSSSTSQATGALSKLLLQA